MKKLKIAYLAGCQTCNDGLTDHINEILESEGCESVTQAVREVTEALNEKLDDSYFKEATIRTRYKRVMKERGFSNEKHSGTISGLQPDSDESTKETNDNTKPLIKVPATEFDKDANQEHKVKSGEVKPRVQPSVKPVEVDNQEMIDLKLTEARVVELEKTIQDRDATIQALENDQADDSGNDTRTDNDWVELNGKLAISNLIRKGLIKFIDLTTEQIYATSDRDLADEYEVRVNDYLTVNPGSIGRTV